MMAHGPRSSLTSTALTCGFSSSSDFSRCFKQRYGTAPSAFDIKGWREAHGSQLRAMVPEPADRLHLDRLPVAHNPDGFRVRIWNLPARTVTYIRVLDPIRGDASSQRRSA
jgi:AraC-like DNA-binding protein